MEKQQYGYKAYVVYSEESMGQEMMYSMIANCCGSQTPETDILLLRKCQDKDIEDTKRWHVCMKKELFEGFKTNNNFTGLKIYTYRPNQKSIGKNNTYAYYIPYNSEESKLSFKRYFKTLEGKFIRPGSYTIHDPLPREGGEDRGYFLVSFEKTGDYYPRPFIRTLRALLNDSQVGEERLVLKWCSHRVLVDVLEGSLK
jgi:hypothetical protein